MSFHEGYDVDDLEDGFGSVTSGNGNSNSLSRTDNLYSSGDSIEISSNTFQTANSIPVITINSDDEDEPSDNDRKWEELPSLAVENIYSFLSRTDQSRMSQVCSRWSNDFHSPCLWKTLKFYLPEHDHSSQYYPEVRFARKYAPMFRHVEIICKAVRTHLIVIIWKQLKYFLKALTTSSQLISIKFISMRRYFRKLDDIIFEDIFKVMIDFFKSQENLKKVVFQDSSFSMEEGMKLLEAILHSDSNTINNLTLPGFVYNSESRELSHQYMSRLKKVCCKIANVHSLEMDYTPMFEDIISNLHEELSSGNYQLNKEQLILASVKICCEDGEQLEFRGILPETWKYLKNIFPDLKIKMDVTIHNHLTNEMVKFLAREMPLEILDFRFRKTFPRNDISELLNHLQICKHQNHLESLNVLWLPSIADFYGSIIPFVQSCQKLKILYLHTNCTPNRIVDVLKALLENHPTSLKSITLWFNNPQEVEDEDSLSAISEEYYALFRSKGIECFLIMGWN